MASLKRQYEKRLQKELADLQVRKPQNIEVYLPDDNLHEWEAIIPGPIDSYYKGGKFKVKINIPEEYPLEPPVIHFVTPIYHLNVSQEYGQVCLGFLSKDNWSASSTIEQIVHALFSLLSKPELENSMDHDLLNQYHHFNWDYVRKAKKSAKNAKATM